MKKLLLFAILFTTLNSFAIDFYKDGLKFEIINDETAAVVLGKSCDRTVLVSQFLHQ